MSKRNEVLKLKQSRLHLGESRIRWWYAIPEEGTPYTALFDPVYWDIHNYKFAIGDNIEIAPDEGHYYAWLKVMSVGAGGVRVEEIMKKEFKAGEVPEALTSAYRVQWSGPYHKWRVIRIADKHVEKAGFDNEGAANEWLSHNLRTLITSARAAQSTEAEVEEAKKSSKEKEAA